MKVYFHSVHSGKFQLDLDGSLKIGVVKGLIQESQGADFRKEFTNIIFESKLLNDESTLEENGVSENGICIVLVSKEQHTPTARSMVNATSSGAGPSNMRGAANEPLIPEAPATSTESHGPGALLEADTTTDDIEERGLARLRTNPQFQVLRALVRQNLDLMEPMLIELGKNNPPLLAQINANQAEFLNILNEPFDKDNASIFAKVAREQMAEQGGGEEDVETN